MNLFFAFLFGIFIYFFLNLIPHYVQLTKKGVIYWIISIIDIIIASVIFVFSLVSTIYRLDLGSFLGVSKEIFINYESWFVLLGNTLISGLFFLLENFYGNDKFAYTIVQFKRNFEFIDNSFWGILIHVAIPVLGFLVIFGFLDLRSFFRLF